MSDDIVTRGEIRRLEAQRETMHPEHRATVDKIIAGKKADIAARAKKRDERELQAAKDQQLWEAKQSAAVAPEIGRFRNLARARYVGNDAEFEQAWPSLLEAWKQDRALGRDQTGELFPRPKVRL
jgi:hypothetical protein